MKNFEEIKKLWSANEPGKSSSAASLANKKQDQLAFLERQYLLGAIGLFCFTGFIAWFAFLSNRDFNFELSYTALALIAACSIIMMLTNIYYVYLIGRIDETLAPQEYLNRWVVFYQKRFQFFKIYAPLLFLALCLSFGLYMPEILGSYPTTNYKIGFSVFMLLVFFGYVVLGKRAMKEERRKLNQLNKNIRMLFEE